MTDKETIFLLSTLHKQLSSEQFEQAKLFLQCINLGGRNLESANDLLDLHQLISSVWKALPAAFLKFILVEIGVDGAEKLIVNVEGVQTAKNLLKFPTLLIKLCQRLGNDDFSKFKACICDAVLNCNPNTVQSRTALMKKLLSQLEISPKKVDVLIEWLNAIGRIDLAHEVEEYKQSLNSLSANTALDKSKEETDLHQSLRSQEYVLPEAPSIHLGFTSSVIDFVSSFNLFKEDVIKPVAENHLEVISKLIPAEWQTFMGVSVGTRDLVGVVREWFQEAGVEATYKSVIEEFLSKYANESAEELCGELAKGKYMFCVSLENSVSSASLSESVAPATGCIESLWDISAISELKVFFMNPGVLVEPTKMWLCNGQQLTTQMILDWAAEGWNNPNADYPQISYVPADFIDASHIRIKFTNGDNRTNQSYVGQVAQAHRKKWTMQLDLYGMDKRDQKSYVLHEFGHALGLEHEHQRVDFWALHKDLASVPKILCKSYQYSSFKFKEGAKRLQTKYDPDSIMHYWFQIEWLKPEYRDLDSKSVRSLPELKRKVVENVHKRDYRKGGVLAEKPSQSDYEALNQLYKLLINTTIKQHY